MTERLSGGDNAATDVSERLRSSQGVIVAALTPFVEESTAIDYRRFQAQLSALRPYRPLAVTVAAVESQEFQVLSRQDRARLATSARDVLGWDIPLVTGVSSPSLHESIAMAKEAEQLGAAAVLAVAAPKPWAAEPLPDEAYRWFSTLADQSPLPVILYNNPRLGVDLSVETMRRICKHDNVLGIKETSRDESKLLALIADVQGHAQVFTNMELLFSTVLLGGAGAMLPTPGVPVASRVVTEILAGRTGEASKWAAFFADFPRRWMRRGLLPVMKSAGRLMGCDMGEPLWPYEGLEPVEVDQLRSLLDSWGLLGVLQETSADPNGHSLRVPERKLN